MRTLRMVVFVLLLGLLGTACGARLTANERRQAAAAVLNAGGGATTNDGTPTGTNPTANPANGLPGTGTQGTQGTKGTQGTNGTSGGNGTTGGPGGSASGCGRGDRRRDDVQPGRPRQ